LTKTVQNIPDDLLVAYSEAFEDAPHSDPMMVGDANSSLGTRLKSLSSAHSRSVIAAVRRSLSPPASRLDKP
jgi:hypothetical protein